MRRLLYSFISILFTVLVSACQEEYIDNPYGGLSGEGISFGIYKSNISLTPNSRTLLQVDTLVLPSESMDGTFGVSVITKEQENSLQSRGIQISSKESLTEFDVSAFYYKKGSTVAELYLKVNLILESLLSTLRFNIGTEN